MELGARQWLLCNLALAARRWVVKRSRQAARLTMLALVLPRQPLQVVRMATLSLLAVGAAVAVETVDPWWLKIPRPMPRLEAVVLDVVVATVVGEAVAPC